RHLPKHIDQFIVRAALASREQCVCRPTVPRGQNDELSGQRLRLHQHTLTLLHKLSLHSSLQSEFQNLALLRQSWIGEHLKVML
ncbi:hypothetical protein ACHAW6_012470, partial [Cyclotella cf. meneghiniana]